MKYRKLNAGRFALSGLAIATACLWGQNAQALGLGRLSVQSALGEPIRLVFAGSLYLAGHVLHQNGTPPR